MPRGGPAMVKSLTCNVQGIRIKRHKKGTRTSPPSSFSKGETPAYLDSRLESKIGLGVVRGMYPRGLFASSS